MNFYLMLKMIYNYQKGDNITVKLIQNNNFFFVPIVNVDGYNMISDYYAQTHQLKYIRKNRNDGKKDGYSACAHSDSLGVDLNRNYGLKWGYSDTGSSRDPCAEDYRGPHAFSEPET